MARLRYPQFKKTVEGSAFPDYIYTEKVRHKSHDIDRKNYSTRTFFLPIILFIAIAVLLGRIFFLQIIKGSYYRELSDNNRIKTVIIHAPRGIVFDRNGVPLVYNVPGFRQEVNGKTQLINQELAINLIAKGNSNLEIDELRQYPFKDAFTHVLGYIGQISKEELDKPEFKNHKASDVVGKMGIEEEYESELKGIDGKKLVEVDRLGRNIRTIGQEDPILGKNITLTLDSSLQKAAFDAVSGVKKGAVVVSTPKGEILTLISKPSFDPNLFTMGEGYKTDLGKQYHAISEVLLDDTNQPFLDRAISGIYPPGSTFKLIVAAAGLENRIIDENFEVEDTGILHVGSFSFSNWYYSQYGRTEGMVNVVRGIKRSNDIFFYRLAQKIGVDKISEMAKKFGLGNALGIDLIGEAKGLVPTENWKKETMNEPWFLGDTYHYGIGQGYLLVTPLQVNMWTSTIANNGVLYDPHLLKNPAFAKASAGKQKFLSDKTVGLIRQGMIEACDTGGVAWPLFDFKVSAFVKTSAGKESEKLKVDKEIKIACKTGTAEHGGENTMPHAWITLFAPAYNPQIIVTVLAEDSGEGSNIAAPIAKKILEEWFGR